jgi:Fe-S cluster assembly iron-binding protein IscA
MLTLTDNAVKRFMDLLKGKNSEDYGIRIFTTGGCCSTGIAIDTADSPKKGDIIL